MALFPVVALRIEGESAKRQSKLEYPGFENG
jgi:hypothetical protein